MSSGKLSFPFAQPRSGAQLSRLPLDCAGPGGRERPQPHLRLQREAPGQSSAGWGGRRSKVGAGAGVGAVLCTTRLAPAVSVGAEGKFHGDD